MNNQYEYFGELLLPKLLQNLFLSYAKVKPLRKLRLKTGYMNIIKNKVEESSQIQIH